MAHHNITFNIHRTLMKAALAGRVDPDLEFWLLRSHVHTSCM